MRTCGLPHFGAVLFLLVTSSPWQNYAVHFAASRRKQRQLLKQVGAGGQNGARTGRFNRFCLRTRRSKSVRLVYAQRPAALTGFSRCSVMLVRMYRYVAE